MKMKSKKNKSKENKFIVFVKWVLGLLFVGLVIAIIKVSIRCLMGEK